MLCYNFSLSVSVLVFRGRAVRTDANVRKDSAAIVEASQRHPGAEVRREEQAGGGALPLPQEQARGLFHPRTAGVWTH